jgi:16S rRNA (cytosine967-C5)-methyltransferase
VISPARDAALDILLRVENHGGFASELLHSERLDKLTPQDRGLCTELVMGVLRWRSRLDEAIASVSSQKFSKLDPEVLESIRLAAYQIAFLQRIPAHAAVNESVELVKRKKKRSAGPFVNAVLRKLIANKGAFEPVLDPGPKTIPDLVLMDAHPLWLVDRWADRYGLEAAAAVCDYDQQVPPVAIHASDESVFDELEATDIQLGPGKLLRRTRRVVNGDVTKTKVFLEGRLSIQDEASQLVALLVGRGERLLDCCAAPGGKTAIIAARNPDGFVLATEIHDHRARALKQRLHGEGNVEVRTADIATLEAELPFDRVLADVPCSGTGTLARNPEIKWRLSPADLADLHARQVNILRAALDKLRPGGRLIYSTCSLEPEENEQVVREVMESVGGFELLHLRDELENLKRDGELLDFEVQDLMDGPFLRTIPGRFPGDGFFAAQIGTSRA